MICEWRRRTEGGLRMSLGLGIFLSAVVLIIAWQIDKRNAWKKVGKATLWILAVLAIAAALAYGYFGWWAEIKARKAHAVEITQLRNPVGRRYWDIALGMSQAEVRYLKGAPTQIQAAGKTPPTDELWSYKLGVSSDSYEYEIIWNDDGTEARFVGCAGGAGYDCEHIGGLGIGSSEKEVRTTLGKPDEDNPPDKDGSKALVYGTGNVRLLIVLTRGEVSLIALERP
jgi:hypothetical protein